MLLQCLWRMDGLGLGEWVLCERGWCLRRECGCWMRGSQLYETLSLGPLTPLSWRMVGACPRPFSASLRLWHPLTLSHTLPNPDIYCLAPCCSASCSSTWWPWPGPPSSPAWLQLPPTPRGPRALQPLGLLEQQGLFLMRHLLKPTLLWMRLHSTGLRSKTVQRVALAVATQVRLLGTHSRGISLLP